MIGTPEGGYRPGLDGIRAVAVSAVLLFHLDRLPGGNLGVDAFFVVSGWLITWKLLSDVDHEGTVRVRRFWTGRVRRLLPASAAVLLAVAVVWPLAGIDVPSLRRDLAWAAVGLSNWGTISSGGDYWARFGDPSPVTHYWSLAIEQQYYLLWPLVLLAVIGLTSRSRIGVAAVGAAGAVASIVFMNLAFDPLDPTATYMNTFSRAHTLLLGAAAGAITTVATDGRLRFGVTARRLAPVGALVALAILLTSSESSTWLFSWGFPTFAAAMTVVVVAVADGAGAPVLATPATRWLADRSYGLYLWHWPVFLFMSPGRLGVDAGSWPAMLGLDLARVAVAVALSDVSFRMLETPIRRRRRLPSWHAPVAAASSFAVLAVLLVAVVPAPSSTTAESVVTLAPPPPTSAVSAPSASDDSGGTPSSPAAPEGSAPPSDGTEKAATNTSPVPLPDGGPATDGSASAPVPSGAGSSVPDRAPDPATGISLPLRVLVTGDSMAVHLAEAMIGFAATRPDDFVAGSAAFGGCGMSAATDGRLHEFTDANGQRDVLDISRCTDQWVRVPQRITEESIDVVVVDIGPWDALDMHLVDGRTVSVADETGRSHVSQTYHRFVDEVRDAGATVVWVRPPDSRLGWGDFDDPVNDPARWRAIRDIVDELDVVQVDLAGWLVANGLDGPDGRPDGVHLTPELNQRFVAEVVVPVLDGLRSDPVTD